MIMSVEEEVMSELRLRIVMSFPDPRLGGNGDAGLLETEISHGKVLRAWHVLGSTCGYVFLVCERAQEKVAGNEIGRS
jgi:hypothetical protein